MSDSVSQIAAALAVYEAAHARCPFARPAPPPFRTPCPDCGALSNEGCRKEVRAAFDFIGQVRTVLSADGVGRRGRITPALRPGEVALDIMRDGKPRTALEMAALLGTTIKGAGGIFRRLQTKGLVTPTGTVGNFVVWVATPGTDNNPTGTNPCPIA